LLFYAAFITDAGLSISLAYFLGQYYTERSNPSYICQTILLAQKMKIRKKILLRV
jgi:hypothetical protein